MNVKNFLSLIGLLTLIYAPCLNSFDALLSFGDSLSDVGSYGVSGIAEAGGGKYSVNFPGSKIWIEILADEIGLNAPCAAMTGLDGSAFGMVSSTYHTGCFGYAQGGARVTNAVGISNAQSLFPGSELGGLTKPLVDQIQQHLSLVGDFNENDLIAIWAGNNDILAALISERPLEGIQQAAEELVTYVKNLVLGKGAQRVVVLNIGDFRYTPISPTLPPMINALMDEYITTFNQNLAAGLDSLKEKILLIDIYTQSHIWGENPQAHGITNLTTPACDLQATLFPSVLLCTPATLVASDISGYFYADSVHPAPKGHQVIADFVIEKLKQHQWLP